MQKGFTQLLLIAIFAIAILSAIGVYFFIFKNQPSENIQKKMVPPTPPTQEEVKRSIYNNDTLGFMFIIPEGAFIKEETEAEFHKRSNGEMRKNFAYYIKYPPAEFVNSLYVLNKDNDYENAPLSLWIFENPDNLDAAAFYKRYWYYPFIWGDYTSAKEKIAPTLNFEISEATGSLGMAAFKPNSPKFIYLPKNGKMYLFKTVGNSNTLDSFKFSN
jgi:hypothetical protein